MVVHACNPNTLGGGSEIQGHLHYTAHQPQNRDNETAQQLRVPVVKPDYVSSTLKPHMVEGKNLIPTPTLGHTHTHRSVTVNMWCLEDNLGEWLLSFPM